MNQIKAKILEKLGKNVNKVILVRYQGVSPCVRPQISPDKKPYPQAKYPQESIKKYLFITSHYFGKNELFWTIGDRTYELHVQNTSYERNETNLQYIDYETGQPVGLNNTCLVAYPPTVLNRLLDAKQLKDLAHAVGSPAGGYVVLAVAVLASIVFGFLLGQNINLQPPPA